MDLDDRIQTIRKRKNCVYRHENGNCLVIGGFCPAVDDKYCKYKEKPKSEIEKPLKDSKNTGQYLT